jgi:hypothetical protein
MERKLHVFLSHASGEAELAMILKERIETDFIGLVKVLCRLTAPESR